MRRCFFVCLVAAILLICAEAEASYYCARVVNVRILKFKGKEIKFEIETTTTNICGILVVVVPPSTRLIPGGKKVDKNHQGVGNFITTMFGDPTSKVTIRVRNNKAGKIIYREVLKLRAKSRRYKKLRRRVAKLLGLPHNIGNYQLSGAYFRFQRKYPKKFNRNLLLFKKFSDMGMNLVIAGDHPARGILYLLPDSMLRRLLLKHRRRP